MPEEIESMERQALRTRRIQELGSATETSPFPSGINTIGEGLAMVGLVGISTPAKAGPSGNRQNPLHSSKARIKQK